MLLVVAGLLFEWQELRGQVAQLRWLSMVAMAWALLSLSYFGLDAYVPAIIVISLFIMVANTVLNYQPNKPVIGLWSYDFTGLVYCTIPLIIFTKIHSHWGSSHILFLLFIIWATDSGAYFSGKLFGRKKMAPALSPGKTWVGFYGGCFSGILAGVAVAYIFTFAFTLLQVILLGGLLSLSGQLGDLAESLLKRESGVKDSGQLIPGHGGLLDRLDSMLFALPVYYLLLLWIGG